MGSTEELCHGYPDEFYQYLNYAKNLEFEQTPDYEYLKNLFKNLMEKNNYVYDLEFDWISSEKKKEEIKKSLTCKIEGQFFQKIKINGEKNQSFKPQPIVLNKIKPEEKNEKEFDIMKNPPLNYNNKDISRNEHFTIYEKSETNKGLNGTNDGKSNGKSLVDMVKNEKNSSFGFNIDERINRILNKTKEKDYQREKE